MRKLQLAMVGFVGLVSVAAAIAGEATLEPEPLPSPPSHPQSSRGRVPQIKLSAAPTRVYRHPGAVLSVAFRPDSEVLATGDATGRVWLWSVVAGEVDGSLPHHPEGVTALAFSIDGTELATGGQDGLVRVWNLKTMQVQSWLDKKHRGSVSAVAYNSSGALILSSSADDSIWVRDVVTGQRITAYFGHSADVVGFVMAPEGLCVISGAKDRSIQSWSLESGEQVDFSTQQAKVTALTLSPDGRMLASATSDGNIELRRTDGCSVHSVAHRFRRNSKAVRTMAFSSDGKWLYAGGDSFAVVKWSVDSGYSNEEFHGHEGAVHALSLSPDGRWLATGSEDGTVRLWSRSVPVEKEEHVSSTLPNP